MKFNFKKITPILASAVLLGSTIAFATVAADLAAYPSPFVSGGAADIAIIYGTDGMAKDMEAAGLFSGDLASELADQTATSATSSTSMAGESVALSTSSAPILYGDGLSVAKTTLTKSDLPTLLADGKVTDDDGNEYSYNQRITLGNSSPGSAYLTFGKSGEAIDPIPYIDIGSSAWAGLYNYTVIFGKVIDVSPPRVYGKSTIKLLGQSYLIGKNSDNDTLILYPEAVKLIADKGVEEVVTISDVEHTLKIISTESTTTGTLEFDGDRKDVTEGNSYTFTGDIEVYIKSIIHPAVAGDIAQMDLRVGTERIKLDAGVSVKKTANDVSVQNTLVNITQGNGAASVGGPLSSFTVGQAFSGAEGDHLDVGESFEDRVFGGFKVDFSALSPALDSEARDTILVKGLSADATVTFTDAITGGEHTFSYAHDQDTSSDAVSMIMADSGNKTIHIQENSTVKENEYQVLDDNDFGTIVKVTQIPACTAPGDELILTNALDTTRTYTVAFGQVCQGLISVEGGNYYVNANGQTHGPTSDGNITFTWGEESGYNETGTAISIFPKIKLKQGGWLVFLDETNVTNNFKYNLPGNEKLSTHKAGVNITFGESSTRVRGIAAGNINYTWHNDTDEAAANTTKIMAGITTSTGSGDSQQMANCNFSRVTTTGAGPAVMFIEPHKAGETNGDEICVGLTTTSIGGATQVAIRSPVFGDSNAATEQILQSDTYKRQFIDKYGTFVEEDQTANTNRYVEIRYPATQMIADVFIAEVSAEATISETSAGITKLGDVLLDDVEAESSKPTDNLIVVGGSAVNKVSAKLLDVDYPTYGTDDAWQDATGVTAEGQAIIKLFTSPYSADKKAMLIAGWSADDTIAAAKQVIDKKSTLADLDVKVIKKGTDYS